MLRHWQVIDRLPYPDEVHSAPTAAVELRVLVVLDVATSGERGGVDIGVVENSGGHECIGCVLEDYELWVKLRFLRLVLWSKKERE